MQLRHVLSLFLLFATPAFAGDNPSGLPIPRFVSLKNDETNIRTGPGTRYPIQWVYRRANMPVEVIDEFEHWRKIRDAEGTTGWVFHTGLSGKRFAMITGKEPRTLHIDASEDSKPLFKAEGQVVGAISECNPAWCRMQISGRKAWIKKDFLWGVYPQEVFD